MALTGKITRRKRGESDRGRERPKKNNTTNLSFFFNNNPLFILSLISFFILPLILLFLFSPIPPFFPPLIPSSPSPGSLIAIPSIVPPNLFYDTRL